MLFYLTDNLTQIQVIQIKNHVTNQPVWEVREEKALHIL